MSKELFKLLDEECMDLKYLITLGNEVLEATYLSAECDVIIKTSCSENNVEIARYSIDEFEATIKDMQTFLKVLKTKLTK